MIIANNLKSCKYWTTFLKLFQKSHIWIHKVSEIRNSVFYHYETIESKAKSKTWVYFGVKSSFSNHSRMYESSTHKFYPSCFFAYFTPMSITKRTREIDLYTWFYEWKVSGSHTNRHLLSKYIRKHRCNREFEVSHTDSCIDDDSLYLIKCVIVCCIHIFISKYSSRNDGSDRSTFISHDEILHAWCLRCENLTFSFEPECILHISCWMIFCDIYCIEVEIFGGDFHWFIDIETHSSKCIFDFLTDTSNRVDTSFFESKWYCDIFFFFFEFSLYGFSHNSLFFRFKSFTHNISNLICHFSDIWAFFWREIFESLEYHSKFSIFSENTIFIVEELYFCFETWEFFEYLSLKKCKLIQHREKVRYDIIFWEAWGGVYRFVLYFLMQHLVER